MVMWTEQRRVDHINLLSCFLICGIVIYLSTHEMCICENMIVYLSFMDHHFHLSLKRGHAFFFCRTVNGENKKEEQGLDAVEMVIPELNEQDQKSYETIWKIIEGLFDIAKWIDFSCFV